MIERFCKGVSSGIEMIKRCCREVYWPSVVYRDGREECCKGAYWSSVV